MAESGDLGVERLAFSGLLVCGDAGVECGYSCPAQSESLPGSVYEVAEDHRRIGVIGVRLTVSTDKGPVPLEGLGPEERRLLETGLRAALENAVSCPEAASFVRVAGRVTHRQHRTAIGVDRHGC